MYFTFFFVCSGTKFRQDLKFIVEVCCDIQYIAIIVFVYTRFRRKNGVTCFVFSNVSGTVLVVGELGVLYSAHMIF